jgi:hypothetical protein
MTLIAYNKKGNFFRDLYCRVTALMQSIEEICSTDGGEPLYLANSADLIKTSQKFGLEHLFDRELGEESGIMLDQKI